jgi:hypothetical protein
MPSNQPQNYDHLIHKVEADIEELNRSLGRPARYGRNPHRAKIEQKQVLQRELAHLRELSEGQKRSKPKWYESPPEITKRRQTVLKNASLTALRFCSVFDSEGIELPGKWEMKFGVTTWTEAYKNKKARANIQRIISEDKKA